MGVEIVIAVDESGGFAKGGKIPWYIPEDFKHFRELTSGGVCIMGRGTYNDLVQMKKDRTKEIPGIETVVASDDIPVLKGRTSYVLTGSPDKPAPGATTTANLSPIVDKHKDVFILGGRRLFIEALGYRDCIIHMTIIKGDTYGCDQHFPVDIINNHFEIVDGRETDLCWYVTYHRKAIQPRSRRRSTIEENINEAYRNHRRR